MMRILCLFAICAGVTACGDFRPFKKRAAAPEPAPVAAPVEEAVPAVETPVEVAIPTEGAQTAEALDTTSDAQRKEAAKAPESGARVLGKTVASLGSPTEPGFWLKTPLVSKETQGSVKNPATGKSATVTLIPIEGEATAGSRMSLPALRLIGASLTELTEVEVSVTG